MATRRVEVDTKEYQFSHGRTPRGYGHWAFEIGDKVQWFQGTYGEAKKQAISLAKDRHLFCTIRVLP